MKSCIRLALLCVLTLVGWAQSSVSVAATEVIGVRGGEVISRVVEVKTKRLIGADLDLKVPIPPGDWLVRHIDKTASTHTTPIQGVALVLDQVVDMRVVANLWFRVHPTNNANWSVSHDCSSPLLRADQRFSFFDYCHSLGPSPHLTNRSSDIQATVRRKRLSDGVSWSSEVVRFSGFASQRVGYTVYYELSIDPQQLGLLSDPSPEYREKLITEVARGFQSGELKDVSDWLIGYAGRINRTVSGNDAVAVGAVQPSTPFFPAVSGVIRTFLAQKALAHGAPSVREVTSGEQLVAEAEAAERRQELELRLVAQAAEAEAAKRRQQELEVQLAAAQSTAQQIPSTGSTTIRSAHALVIGNAAYPGSGRLDNPVNDANAISLKLRSMGFTVTTVTDANRQRLVQAMSQFRRSAASADLSLLFYSGHGVQIFGTNYILPTDVDQTDTAQATIQGVRLNEVIENFMPGKTKIVFLDACRDNPLQRTGDRSVTKGLAPISVAEGTLISYATKDGQVAADGVGSKNSPFTQALLEHLADPQDIGVVLRKVREKVMKATGGKQQPWEYGSLTGGELVLSQIKGGRP